MKITKKKLQKLISEELDRLLSEQNISRYMRALEYGIIGQDEEEFEDIWLRLTAHDRERPLSGAYMRGPDSYYARTLAKWKAARKKRGTGMLNKIATRQNDRSLNTMEPRR